MTYLLDTNVLIALGWETHAHHDRTLKWFQMVESFATCPITQLGFLRISMALPNHSADFASLRATLDRITKHSAHKFFPCDEDFRVLPQTIRGHQQITDCYLSELASAHRAKLATLEKVAFAKNVFVIPAI